MFEGDAVIATVQHWEKVIAHAQAQQMKAMVALVELRSHSDGAPDDYTADEIALALGISGVARQADRRIIVTPADDGMAELWAYLPAAAAAAIYETVNGCASRGRTADDDRTADQRRADAFVDLILGQGTGPAACPGVDAPPKDANWTTGVNIQRDAPARATWMPCAPIITS